MPPHLSHLLQPLNVGCFLPLKWAYKCQIESLIHSHINHITKLEFLPAFKAVFNQLITKQNICASFKGAGLVPFNPDTMLFKFNVVLHTPSPQALPKAP